MEDSSAEAALRAGRAGCIVAVSGGHVVSGQGTAAPGWPAKVRVRRSVRPQRFARELPRRARAGGARRRVPGRAERNRARHRRDSDRARRPDRAGVRPRGRVRGCSRRLDPVRPRQPRRTGPASEAVLEREGARASARRRASSPRAHLAADRLRFRAGRAHGRDVRRRRAPPAGARFYGFIVPGAFLWAAFYTLLGIAGGSLFE